MEMSEFGWGMGGLAKHLLLAGKRQVCAANQFSPATNWVISKQNSQLEIFLPDYSDMVMSVNKQNKKAWLTAPAMVIMGQTGFTVFGNS
jgi:hypothetical protein